MIIQFSYFMQIERGKSAEGIERAAKARALLREAAAQIFSKEPTKTQRTHGDLPSVWRATGKDVSSGIVQPLSREELHAKMTAYADQEKFKQEIPDDRMRAVAVQAALEALRIRRNNLVKKVKRLDEDARTAAPLSAAWFDDLKHRSLLNAHSAQFRDLKGKEDLSEAQKSLILTKSDRERISGRRAAVLLARFMPVGDNGLADFNNPQYVAARDLAKQLVNVCFLNIARGERYDIALKKTSSNAAAVPEEFARRMHIGKPPSRYR